MRRVEFRSNDAAVHAVVIHVVELRYKFIDLAHNIGNGSTIPEPIEQPRDRDLKSLRKTFS